MLYIYIYIIYIYIIYYILYIYIYILYMLYIYIPPIPNHISCIILYLPFLHPFSLASVASVASLPSPRDEEETEDALHEAGEGVVRVGRSREGDLPHADGQNATCGAEEVGMIGDDWDPLL